MKKPVYVLDAYALIYRSYFAFISRPLTNQEGRNISAIFGFFRTLHALFKEHSPELFIAAFDSRKPTFRHEMYDQYKATRQKTPEDLHAQVPVIEEILTALGLALLRQDGFEADDIIASVATRCRAEGRPCIIISGDKDLMQLVGPSVSILKPGKTGGWDAVDEQGVRSEWGVGPELMLDLLSLTGDASDNVPGVKGIGDKTALKLLESYGTLDGIYAHADELTGAIGKKIVEGKDMAYFSRKLIALCEDVPIDRDLDAYSCHTLDTLAAGRLLMREGLPSIAKLYNSKAGAEEGESTKIASSNEPSLPQVHPLSGEVTQTTLEKNKGNYHAVSDAASLEAYIQKGCTAGCIAFDCETTGLDVAKDSLVGFSLSHTIGEGIYVPLALPQAELGSDIDQVMEKEKAFELLTTLFAHPKVLIVMHNGKFDLQVLGRHGIFQNMEGRRPQSKLFDTMIAAWLLDPDWASFSLESLSQSQLSLETIAYDEVVPKGSTFQDVPLAQATQYAAEDADLTLRLYQRFAPRLKEAGLDTLFTTMEMPLVPILAQMERAGIRIEKEALSSYSEELTKELESTEQRIFAEVGHSFNVASPKQLQEILFTERKLTPGKKTKTGYSTDNSVLENLAAEDVLPGMILDYRALAKLKSTYVDALPLLADTEGRIHTSFIQTGTATGRLSSRDPNLQNIPIRDENGRRIRSAFRAEKGFHLISADYAQIELVILAHLSGDKNLVDAFTAGVDVHRRTASLIFGISESEVTADMRRVAKTINFGVMYGMSAFRLSNELRIPRGQAATFINTYFQTYSGVSSFIEETKKRARASGYVETLMGRKRYIRSINSSNKLEQAGAERIAVNTPIQGSAADIVKTAMIRVDAALREQHLAARLLLQVHDELILECPAAEVSQVKHLVQKEMEGVIRLAVPLRVSVESGVSWGDFH